MGFLDKAMAAAEQAATRARETADELQTKRALGQAYGDLGRAAFALVDSGELSNATLDQHVEKIRSLKAQLDSAETVGATAASDESPGSPAG